MKIFVNDNTNFKFSMPIINYWLSKGHEVDREIGANPDKAEKWADLVYIDFLDNNFYCYFNRKTPIKKIFVRGVDIDIWMGRHRDPVIWDYMTGMIVINPKLYDMVKREGNPPEGKLHLIRPGLDLSKFTYRELLPDIYQPIKIAMVTGDLWEMKNPIEGYRIFQLLVKRHPEMKFELHIRGQHHSREMEQIMKDHVMLHESLTQGMVTLHGPVNDMNTWLDDKHFILVPSLKEAFSYATAEAMAKGIKPILNNWWGADDIWPKEYLYHNLDEAHDMFFADYKPREYHDFVANNYSFERMMREYDALMGT